MDGRRRASMRPEATGEVLLRVLRQGVAVFVVLSPADEGGQ
ncbi:MAG TPA: hypothetical protein VMS88_01485 [Terriglobales bacterium]|nr:hypothetical protein [Terriglobales bacterium]